MNYKHIIFDFNGTLVDSTKIMQEILTGLISKSRFKSLTHKDFVNVQSLPFLKKVKIFLFFAKYQKEFMRQFDKKITSVNFSEGIKPMLKQLNEKSISFSILSSNTTETIIKFFKMHDLTVESVYRSQRLLGKKKVLKKFIRQKHCKPNDIIYVCDEIRDIKACNTCGVDVVFVGWGTDAGKDLIDHNIKLIAQTPAELYEYLIYKLE